MSQDDSTTGRAFEGRVVVVTGAGSGIGAACAVAFADAGASVALADVDEAAADRVRMELPNGHHRTYTIDLADADACRRLLPSVHSDLGRIDVVVNNAADIGNRLELAEVNGAEWDRVLAVNLTAPFLLAQSAASLIAPDAHGSIVNVGSIQRRLPLARHVPYVASKGGLDGLTRALAVELAPRGIRVNAVEPGVIETPGMAEERRHSAGGGESEVGTPATLTASSGTPADVAAAVAFLASPANTHLTGATLTVDGGRSISRRPDPLAPTDPTDPRTRE